MLFVGLLILLGALKVGFRLLEQLVSANAHLARIGLQLTDLQQTATDLRQTAGLLDDRLCEGLLRIPEIERGILAVEEECARVRGHVAGVEVSVERIERSSCD